MGKYVQTAAGAIGIGAAFVLYKTLSQRRRRNLAGQVVFITGGSRGLGLALAREFASLNCRLALCARDDVELTRVRQALKGSEVFTVACDISDHQQVTDTVNSVVNHYGRIDILVNNAGEITVAPFENLTLADFERGMAVMFWGMLYATLAVLPSMKNRGHGQIVNITSIGGKVSVPHLLSYSCAKAAAVALSNGLRSEVKKFGIEVTTIVPGLMRTGSHVNALFKGNLAEEAAWFGTAASLPLLSLNAERAARLTVDAICAGKPETILGVPAKILSQAQNLFPGWVSELFRLSNTWLPQGGTDSFPQAGRELEKEHGSLYRLLTTLGRQAGGRLNQPV